MLPSIALQKIHSYDAPGGSGNGKSIDISGDTAAFGRTKGGQELSLLDLRHASSGPLALLSGQKISATVDRLMADAGSVIALTADPDREAIIYSSSSNRPSLEKIGEFDLPERAAGILCSEGIAYVAVRDPKHPIAVLKLEHR